MGNTSVSKLDSAHSPRGPEGEAYLASGVRVAMRLWDEPTGFTGPDHARDYEVVGYVLEGRAELHVEGQLVLLSPGDSYVVARGARHHYRILDHLRAVEATSPPAQVHGRDFLVFEEQPTDDARSADAGDGVGRRLRALRRHRSRASATYHRLIDETRDANGLKTNDAAESALLVVLEGLCKRLPKAQADHLLRQLSSIAREELDPLADQPDKKITSEAIETELERQLHVSNQTAANMLATTCSVIARHISPGQAASVRQCLPAELRRFFPED